MNMNILNNIFLFKHNINIYIYNIVGVAKLDKACRF